MPSALPSDPPADAPAASAGRPRPPFGVYVHVPFCATRCGYCDFNTYTAGELGAGGLARLGTPAHASPSWTLAAAVLGPGRPPVTVFVGGGTPTLLPAGDLAAVLDAVRATFGLAADAEVTTEANPESTSTRRSSPGCAAAGFTRVSLGMQSAAPHVLAVLDRRHTPGRAAARRPRRAAAGFEHVNLDLIYGTPGETAATWRASLDAALARRRRPRLRLRADRRGRHPAGPRRCARGELPAPDDDVLADRTSRPTRAVARPAWAGTRCPTGPPRPPAAGTTIGYWGGGELVGRRARRAQPRRRRALVERQAPRRVRRPAGRRQSPAAGRRDARRRGPRWSGYARAPPARRPAAGAAPTRRAGGRHRASPTGCSTAAPGDRLVLTRRGRLLADAVVRDLPDSGERTLDPAAGPAGAGSAGLVDGPGGRSVDHRAVVEVERSGCPGRCAAASGRRRSAMVQAVLRYRSPHHCTACGNRSP